MTANRAQAFSLCVYCSATDDLPTPYQDLAKQAGDWIARNNMRLVYGGGHVGMMGLMADAALENGGEVYGIITEYLAAREIAHQGVTKLYTEIDMQARQRKMADLADAFLVLPGGLGTLYEFSEILALRSLNLVNKPIIFYNANGYWDFIFKWTHKAVNDRLIRQSPESLFTVCENFEQIKAELFTD